MFLESLGEETGKRSVESCVPALFGCSLVWSHTSCSLPDSLSPQPARNQDAWAPLLSEKTDSSIDGKTDNPWSQLQPHSKGHLPVSTAHPAHCSVRSCSASASAKGHLKWWLRGIMQNRASKGPLYHSWFLTSYPSNHQWLSCSSLHPCGGIWQSPAGLRTIVAAQSGTGSPGEGQARQQSKTDLCVVVKLEL